MTLIEKREVLHEYCSKCDCYSCKLIRGNWETPTNEGCLDIELSPETDLDKALALIGKTPTETDAVNHPSHYNDGKIEVIDYIRDKGLDFCLGNAVKYISRAGKKDPSKEVEDLKKAVWYLNYRIAEIEGDTV